MLRLLFVLTSLFVATSTFAADFTIQPITIAVPAGFDGPIRQEQRGGVVVGFAKSGNNGANTLLQVTMYDLGPGFKELSESELAAAASTYLLDFVGGVERRRTNFQRTEPVPLKISGRPAAKLQWTGKVQGMNTVGVMYCFVVASKVISFHTQDLGSTPTAAMKEAISSFESAPLRNGD